MSSELPIETASPPPRGKLNEARWEEVLGVASEIFSDKGYRATTLRDLASRLGMEKGSLYYYIESKEDLLFEILRRGHELGLQFVTEDEVIAAAPPTDRLAAVIRRWMVGRATMPKSMYVAEYDLRYLRSDRRAVILSLRRQIEKIVKDILSAGVSDGSFDSTIDPLIATATLFRILSSTNYWYRTGGPVEWSDVTEWYVRLMLAGLRADPPVSGAPRRPSSGRQDK